MAHSLHINLNSANTLIPRTIETDNLLDQVPISVITFECRQLICSQLNRKKILLSPEGLPRDWRGVLQCIQLRNVTARDFINEKDPFGRVFDHWLRKEGNTATLSNFQAILKRIDRFDTFHDTRQYFGNLFVLFMFYCMASMLFARFGVDFVQSIIRSINRTNTIGMQCWNYKKN